MRKVHEQSCHERRAFAPWRAWVTALWAALWRVALWLALMLAPAGVARAAEPYGEWEAPLLRNHPLVGKIFDAATGREISRWDMEQRAKKAAIVLLGETHDNPDHHVIQAITLKESSIDHETPPAVVFEMIGREMQPRLDKLMRLKDLNADMIFDAVRWEQSGWPDRDLYRPVMEAVLELKAPILAAGLPREMAKRASREGIAAVLSAAERQKLKLPPLPPEEMDDLVKSIVKSHCDMIPEKAARKMAEVQRLRDALMAARLMDGWRMQGRAVLIAGTGHVRKDRAVPFYLKHHEGAPTPLVIWIAEVQEEDKTLADVLPGDAAPAALVDIVVITPRAEREDPCRQFEQFMKRKERKARMERKERKEQKEQRERQGK